MLGVDNTHITGVGANVTAPVNAPYTVSERGIGQGLHNVCQKVYVCKEGGGFNEKEARTIKKNPDMM